MVGLPTESDTQDCDNQSVLALLKANHAGVKGTKHLKVRYFFIRQHVLSEEIELVWCKTKDMLADIFTKPVTGQLFKDMIARILKTRRVKDAGVSRKRRLS